MRLPILAVATFAIAVGSAGTSEAAKRKVQVPHRYDGRWSIEVVTLDGPCDRAYRYGIQIQRGEAVYSGGEVGISGRVAANGTVRGTISRGSDAAQVFVLVYNLHDSERLFRRYLSGEGHLSAGGGFSAQYLRRGDVVLIPIRLGVGWRAGINAGYMRFSERSRWLPF